MTQVNDAANFDQEEVTEETGQFRSTRNLFEDNQQETGYVKEKSRLLFTIPVKGGAIPAIEVWSDQIYIPPDKKKASRNLYKDTIYAFHLSSRSRSGIEIITYEDKKTKKTRRVYELLVQSEDELLVQSEDSSQSSDEAKSYVTRLREWLWEIPLGSQNLMEQWWKTYLIVVNPFSGFQKGRKRFLKVVQPIMDECRIKYDVIFTERSLQGMEIGQTTPAGKYDAIIGMSGDGLINEILNGMMNRPDKEVALKTPLGTIANGTSNCYAAEVMDGHGDNSIENALLNSTLHAIKGQPKKFNLMRIQVGTSEKVLHCFQLITWGMLANVEFDSIPLRKLGPLRYIVYTVKHVILKKKFLGDVWINLVPSNQWNEKYTKYFENCSCHSKDKEFLTSVKTVLSQSSSTSQPVAIENDLPKNSTWVKLPSTEFLLVCFANTRRWGLDLIGCKFLEHEEPLGYIVIARHPLKRLDIVRAFFLLEKGDHQKLDCVEIYCVKGLRVKPDTNNSPVTYIALDGEKQSSQNYQIDVIPQAINLLF